jgi:hypothetical protein
MNLHDVRASFESRVASIDRETSYLLGKLALVSEAQRIAAEIGGASPVSSQVSGEPTGSFSQTVTALPATEPAVDVAAETASAPAPVIESAPEPVEESSLFPNVSQLMRTSATEEPVADAVESEDSNTAAEPAPAAAAEDSEPEPQQDAEAEAPAAAAVTDEPEEAEAVAEEAEADADDEPSLDARVDQVLAEFEQAAMVEASQEQAAEVEEPAAEAEPVEAEARDDSSENTAELEKLTEIETAEAEVAAEAEAEESEPEEQPDALASLREKLASAAAEEPPKSPFLTLGKFLNRAK